MVAPKDQPSSSSEKRLEQLREEALARGGVAGGGVIAAGGPVANLLRTPETERGPGYYGLPLLKPPVWKWMIPVYFFIGGLAGMSALIAAASLAKHDWALVRTAMWIAAVGGVLSPVLLIWDLGRPRLFLNMLRVFKLQSPMSVGSWVVSGFGAFAIPGAILCEWHARNLVAGVNLPVVHGFAVVAVVGATILGIFLATYTGALLAVTAVPAWHLHRGVLPFHFGVAGLGSAAGALELLGHPLAALHAIGYGAAGAETLVMLWMELRRHGAADRALREGEAGWMLRIGETLAGPAALVLRAFASPTLAAGAFLIGALLTRFGWVSAGRRSACDPTSVFAAQGVAPPKRAP